MQLRKFLGIVMLSSVSALSVGAAHAEGLTRAQVRQQLIEAQQDGLGYVTDASYPDISPVYKAEVEQRRAKRAHDSGFGGQTDGSTASGIAGTAAAMPVQTGSPAPKDNCVGPVSFCNLYSGG